MKGKKKKKKISCVGKSSLNSAKAFCCVVVLPGGDCFLILHRRLRQLKRAVSLSFLHWFVVVVFGV